jgi:hypothetical protein
LNKKGITLIDIIESTLKKEAEKNGKKRVKWKRKARINK